MKTTKPTSTFNKIINDKNRKKKINIRGPLFLEKENQCEVLNENTDSLEEILFNRMIRKGLIDSKNGNKISHSEMKDFIQSLDQDTAKESFT